MMLSFIDKIPDKLKRITSGNKIINEIDGLRFIAITTVVIQHLHERFVKYTAIEFIQPVDDSILAFIVTRGFIGVFIFFAISGFILSLPFATKRLESKNDLNLAGYYWRRVTRLEPPFLIWMTCFFLVFLIFRGESFSQYLPHYLASITYTHGLFYQGWSPFNPPTWTLEVEVQFYIIAPFLAFAFFSIGNKTFRRIVLVSFILVFMIVQQYFEFFRLPWYLTILAYLHYFLIGFLLTDIYLNEWKGLKIRTNFLYDVIAISSLAGIVAIWDWDFKFYARIADVSLIFVFVFCVFKGHYLNKFFTHKWITAIGGMCYTIYLIHLPLLEFFVTLTKNISVTRYYEINLLFQVFIFFPIILIVSAVGYLLFEKPFMKKDWPKILLNKLNLKNSSDIKVANRTGDSQ